MLLKFINVSLAFLLLITYAEAATESQSFSQVDRDFVTFHLKKNKFPVKDYSIISINPSLSSFSVKYNTPVKVFDLQIPEKGKFTFEVGPNRDDKWYCLQSMRLEKNSVSLPNGMKCNHLVYSENGPNKCMLAEAFKIGQLVAPPRSEIYFDDRDGKIGGVRLVIVMLDAKLGQKKLKAGTLLRVNGESVSVATDDPSFSGGTECKPYLER